MRVVDQAKALLREKLKPGDWAIDATAGNGHDTVFLKACVGDQGRVWAFDVQMRALEQTMLRLRKNGLEDVVELIHGGHEQLLEKIPLETQGNIRVVMFNLGYLPGGDKYLITKKETTLSALNQALEVLSPGGTLSIILYPGHSGGDEEAEAILEWATQLGEAYHYEHKKPEQAHLKRSPELVLIEKLGQ